MSTIIVEHLTAGIVFGDPASEEYVYLPAGEIGATVPLCILKTPTGSQDITLEQAVRCISRLNLRPIHHPQLGFR
ncbi:MAG: hypothetical protein ABFC84_12000 [Veillonellales bacterium]